MVYRVRLSLQNSIQNPGGISLLKFLRDFVYIQFYISFFLSILISNTLLLIPALAIRWMRLLPALLL